jgi:DNA-binding transcriptional LysR family regulator
VNLKFQLDDLRVFCLAARKASFAATAMELGTSQAFVSKRIAILGPNTTRDRGLDRSLARKVAKQLTDH